MTKKEFAALRAFAGTVDLLISSGDGAYYIFNRNGNCLSTNYTGAELLESITAYGGSHPDFAAALYDFKAEML